MYYILIHISPFPFKHGAEVSLYVHMRNLSYSVKRNGDSEGGRGG